METSTNGAGAAVEAAAAGREDQRGVAELGFGAGGRAAPAGVPDPELVEQAKRRSFTAEYKARILAEADACTRPGEVGELLRREGLYTSHLTYWRKQRKDGALKELGQPRGRKPADRRDAQIAALTRRAERAEAELAKAKQVIEIQGNVSALLEEMLGTGQRRAGAPSDDRATVEELTPIIGTRPACRALGASPATIYRRRRPPEPRPPRPRPTPARALIRARAPGGARRAALASGSSTSPRRRSGRRCWTRAATCARRARCTGSSPPTTAGCGSDATSSPTPPTRSPSCSPSARTSSGAGTSRS